MLAINNKSLSTHYVALAISTLFLMMGCSGQVDRAEIVGYGITDNISAEIVKRQDAVLGKDGIYDGWNLLEKTTQIPNVENIQFGVEYVVHGSSMSKTITVEEVIIFPSGGLINPVLGKNYLSDESKMKIHMNKPNSFCYRFETSWEQIPGIWVFQIKYKGKILAEQKFEVVEERDKK
ncbi:MAG: DUF3859 domain-containing protein [Pontiella sp.]